MIRARSSRTCALALLFGLAACATPVAVEQSSVPFDPKEFRVTVPGSSRWSVECYELEVHRCPIPFVKLWQSLDEIIGDLPQR